MVTSKFSTKVSRCGQGCNEIRIGGGAYVKQTGEKTYREAEELGGNLFSEI